MSFRVRQILVAIRDERRAPRAPLRKAAALARANGARIELFHAINEPEALDALRRGSAAGHPTAEITQALTARAEKRLGRLAALEEFKGLKVTCTATWDFPPHEAIIRRAIVSNAGLVIASAQPRETGGRLLLGNTDWELIRHCPCPVLIVKSTKPWRRPAVIASVDPFHAHDKPASLDRRILEAGEYFARELKGALHVFHAYMPMPVIAPAPAGQALAVEPSPALDQVHTTQVENVLNKVAARAGIPPRRRHLSLGITADELDRVVRETGAGLVVLGAVSRSGLKRLFIGSTAETVLDRLDCDLLVVKPRDFDTKVPRRTTLAWLKG
jgi:universal stress protein E